MNRHNLEPRILRLERRIRLFCPQPVDPSFARRIEAGRRRVAAFRARQAQAKPTMGAA